MFSIGTIHLRRRHVLGGEGGSPLPMFADARGGGVLGLPTSSINPGRHKRGFLEAPYKTLIDGPHVM